MMEHNKLNTFPKNFVWGAATSSFQIEGAVAEGGRTESIWDRFCKTPGNILDGSNGDIACDHYHRYPEDVKLIADFGVSSYRFSIAWPRIFPEKGKVNPEGLQFYQNLIDEVKKNGLQPAITLYHWDLPQWLQDEGGWVNRESIDHFMEYAKVILTAFGDQVPMWFTFNEPWCAAFLSYGVGAHAPGHTDWLEALQAAHHMLLAHGHFVRWYKEQGYSGQIGIVLNLEPSYAATDSAKDLAAERRKDGYTNRWFLDPIFRGTYPQDMKEWFQTFAGSYDFIFEEDMGIIQCPGDFLAINYYSRVVVKHHEESDHILKVEYIPQDAKKTAMEWEVHPESLYLLLKRLQSEYTHDFPIYIAENGAAYEDELIDGQVDDQERLEYFQSHLEACLRFTEEGGNLAGYYAWSFMDNFEWAFGYARRFGIVYVDYETQERIVKKSGHWFKSIVESNKG